jgi:hypothetical protein
MLPAAKLYPVTSVRLLKSPFTVAAAVPHIGDHLRLSREA